MPKRRKFSSEFKRGAVEQTCQPDVSCAQVAQELGINANLLTRWKREAEAEGRHAFGGTGNPRAARRRVSKLHPHNIPAILRW